MPFLKNKIRRARFWWSLIAAYLTRYKLRLTITILPLLLVIFTTFKIWPTVFQSNIASIGFVGTYTLETIPTQVLSLATQSLILPDAQGKPAPSLASHWTASEDGKTYIVFLKDNLKWHDLSSVEAKDISIAINNVQVTALNNKALEFKLPNPISSFPLALDKPVFKAKSFFGTGDFRIVDIDQIEGVVKKINLHPKDRTKPQVVIKFYQKEEQAQTALKMGEIKSANLANAQIFEKWPNVDVEKKIDHWEIATVFFNNQDPALSSKDLRQALSFALNKSGFDGHIAFGPISSSSWAYNENVKRYDYNVSKAKELLSKINLQNSKITLSYTTDLEKVASQIKQDWMAIGIDVELKLEKTVPENFQALLAVNELSPDPDQYALWHSTQKYTNITGYKNVKIDKLLEDARTTQDENKRKELYFDFQRFLVEDAPAIFLYHPYKYQVIYKNIKPVITKLSN